MIASVCSTITSLLCGRTCPQSAKLGCMLLSFTPLCLDLCAMVSFVLDALLNMIEPAALTRTCSMCICLMRQYVQLKVHYNLSRVCLYYEPVCVARQTCLVGAPRAATCEGQEGIHARFILGITSYFDYDCAACGTWQLVPYNFTTCSTWMHSCKEHTAEAFKEHTPQLAAYHIASVFLKAFLPRLPTWLRRATSCWCCSMLDFAPHHHHDSASKHMLSLYDLMYCFCSIRTPRKKLKTVFCFQTNNCTRATSPTLTPFRLSKHMQEVACIELQRWLCRRSGLCKACLAWQQPRWRSQPGSSQTKQRATT